MKKYNLLILLLANISACVSPGYQCPLNALPGTCSSQIQAYRQSLTSNGEADSIFLEADQKSGVSRATESSNESLSNNAEQKFYYIPPKLFRTWLAPYSPDKNTLINGHFVYWAGEDGHWENLSANIAEPDLKLLRPAYGK